MLITDLRELKTVLDIEPDDTSEDRKLNFFIEYATNWIEEIINRPGLSFKSRTEYYNGTGTTNLLLRSRPVFLTPTIQVFVDDAAYYGSADDAFSADTALTFGEDFCMDLRNSDDGTSKNGIMVRLGGVWELRPKRDVGMLSPYMGAPFGNIKIIYSGGYTVDSLPSTIRMACNLIVARLRAVFPLGMELGSEGYEERSIAIVTSERTKLLAVVAPMLNQFRNWRW